MGRMTHGQDPTGLPVPTDDLLLVAHPGGMAQMTESGKHPWNGRIPRDHDDQSLVHDLQQLPRPYGLLLRPGREIKGREGSQRMRLECRHAKEVVAVCWPRVGRASRGGAVGIDRVRSSFICEGNDSLMLADYDEVLCGVHGQVGDAEWEFVGLECDGCVLHIWILRRRQRYEADRSRLHDDQICAIS